MQIDHQPLNLWSRAGSRATVKVTLVETRLTFQNGRFVLVTLFKKVNIER